MLDKTCETCGLSYRPKRSNQKFCKDCKNKGDWWLSRFSVPTRLSKLCSAAKNRANLKHLPFNIDTKYLQKLWEDQNGCCVVSGRKFNLDAYGNQGQVNPDAPSLDRINPILGYVKGNLRLVTYLTNICLNEYGHENLLDLCQDILEQAGSTVIRNTEVDKGY